MKFLRRYNLKKVLVLSLVLFGVFSLLFWYVTNFFYQKYAIASNQFINYVIYQVKMKYPDVLEEELVLELNDSNPKAKENVLKKYGFDINNGAFLKSFEDIYAKQLMVVSLGLGGFFLGLLFIYMVDSYFKNRQIREVIKTLARVNAGIYDLQLEEYSEGDLAVLKEEVYKTTLVLREKALESLKGKNDLKDSIANISHQLKTPLTSILIMVDNLLDEDIDKKMQKEFLEDIQKQTEYINFLIVAMLKLSRFDADVVVFNQKLVNVRELIFEVLKKVEALANHKDVKIHVKGSSEVFLNCDFHWELEALTNIVKNAIEYTPSGKNIYIQFSDNSFYTKIVIQDEGKGMNEATVRRVFERFFKANDNSQSIGIGLALAKEIIEKDNGSITVKSVKNEGTIFVIKYFK